MKLKELISVVFDKVIIYQAKGDGIFEDIYKGDTNNIPLDVLEMEIRIVGATRKGVVDI